MGAYRSALHLDRWCAGVRQPGQTDNSSKKKATAVAVTKPPPVQPQAAQSAKTETKDSPRMFGEATADLFAPKSWYIAPPPPPPPKPVAPTFPYAFTGKLLDGKAVTLFVTLGQRNYILHKGDVIDSNYRLEEIGEGVAVFTYLPMEEKQILQIGTSK